MEVSIIGPPSSGKSTVAAIVAGIVSTVRGLKPQTRALLAGHRLRNPPEAWAKQKPSPEHPLVCLLHERDRSSVHAYGAAFLVKRHRSLEAVAPHAAGAAGGVLVWDSPSSAYLQALESYRSEVNADRERHGRPASAAMGPEAWACVNARYWKALGAPCKAGADAVLVHRQGAVMVPDDTYGLIESEGTKARGQAESGGDVPLILTLSGGLRSGRRAFGDRALTVCADAARLRTGELFQLPHLTSSGALLDLRRGLWSLLAPSVAVIMEQSDAERLEWDALSEAEDDWPEARAGGERRDAAQLLDRYQTILWKHGLGGTSAATLQLIRPILSEFLGYGSLTAAKDAGIPASLLRDALPLFEQRVEHAALADRVTTPHPKNGRGGARTPPSDDLTGPLTGIADPFE